MISDAIQAEEKISVQISKIYVNKKCGQRKIYECLFIPSPVKNTPAIQFQLSAPNIKLEF